MGWIKEVWKGSMEEVKGSGENKMVLVVVCGGVVENG